MNGLVPYINDLQKVSLYWGLATILMLVIFLIFWLKEPRRLINGITFTIFFVSFLAELAVLIFSTANLTFVVIMGTIFLLIVGIITIILLFTWALLLWNAFVVWKKETHTISNMLTLLLAIVLIALWIFNGFVAGHSQFLPNWFNTLISGLPAIGLYLIICSYNFLINVFLYQFLPKRYKADYLIVLGAGLIGGDKVSRLLGNRIDAAIKFAHKQTQKGRKTPKIVFSGGQGPDEKLSEAKAMAQYAIAHGWNEKLTLLEDKSRNTLQNMQYSKIVIEKDFNSNAAKIKFFSNNYHIFRAGLYAKMANLNANGIGAPTRFYFLPNALIREFVAVFLMNKKRHMIVIGIIILIILLLVGVTIYTDIVAK
ncbi:YdcF family protein [Companilactobacillus halodurans]|uniref:YdcF family protein n=1 Tax=Companilactobacillus halodurans TaxID=2584183 RepID=A0A5P0ZN74_9LACO|nr:YdcF family protein [Companilactobacillus halodurans]MQS75683.1 YdcF family protein [Companilactobacillus halodurans]MQS97669.1 YdcF family protein [Companilactobacillus halodurans]